MVGKPSDKEQEYFLQLELERLKRLREEHQQRQEDELRATLKEAHWMHCAKCGASMETARLESVEVEVCPSCGGIYLDAGELDKVLEERRQGPFAAALGKLRGIWKD